MNVIGAQKDRRIVSAAEGATAGAADRLELLGEQFADLYDYAPVGYATLDDDWIIHRINVTGAAMLGCARDAAVGTRITTYVRPDSRTRFATFLRGVFSGSGSSTCEVDLLAGHWRAEHVQIVAAPPSTGRDLGHPGPQIRIALVDITERRRAEDALRETERRHAAVISAMAEGVVVHAADGTIVSANTAAERILGLTADEICGRRPRDPRWKAVQEDGRPFPAAEHPAAVVLRTGLPQWDVVMGVATPDDEIRWINVRAEPVRGAGGKVTGAVATFADVTESRRREAELRTSREHLAQVLEGGSDGFWEWDVGAGRATFSARLNSMLGAPGVETECDASSWPDRVDPAQRGRLEAGLAAVAAGRVERIDSELRVRTAGGAWKWLRFKGRIVVRGRDGRAIRMAGTASDITEFRDAGERLRRSEVLHRAIARSIPGAAVFLVDPDLRIVLAEGPALAREGFDGKDMEGRIATGIALPDGSTFDGDLLRAAFRGERGRRQMTVADRAYSLEVGPVTEADGQVTLAVVSAIDVTPLKRVEEELRRSHELLAQRVERLEVSEARYRGLHESLADGFVLVDPGGAILDFNEAYRRMLGYEPDELRRMTYLDLTPEAWHAFEARIVEEQVVPLGHSAVYEKEYRRKDGSVFPVELRTFAMRDPERGLTFWAIVRDVGHRKRI